MSKGIQKGVSLLSIGSDETVRDGEQPKKQHKRRRPEHWIYGYRFKNLHARQIAQKYGLPWKSRPFSTLQKVIDYIEALSGDSWRLETIPRHRVFGNARIIYFAEDNERKRLSNLEATEEEMDKVRKVLGFPSGTKPKWYCCDGRRDCDDDADSSDDEVFPGMKPAPPRPPAIEGDSDSDMSDDSDSDMDFDSDWTYDPNEGDGVDAEQ
ncbi:hypothetical protein ACEPAI_2683 [Sanghuangporus weigelae]